MSLTIRCECGTRLNVADTLLGKRVKCPNCKRKLLASANAASANPDVKAAAPARSRANQEPFAKPGKPSVAGLLKEASPPAPAPAKSKRNKVVHEEKPEALPPPKSNEADNRNGEQATLIKKSPSATAKPEKSSRKLLFLVLPLLLLLGGGAAVFWFFPEFLGLGAPAPVANKDPKKPYGNDPTGPKKNLPSTPDKTDASIPDKKDKIIADANPGDPNPREKEIKNSIGMRLVRIEPGKFVMGSPAAEKEREAVEEPHEVEITQPFYLGKFEVTQQQFKAIMGTDPSKFKGGQLPVENVTWNEAREFCARLSAKEGRTYSLPTEAEWEFACRAGSTTPFHTGNALTTDLANYNGNFIYANGSPGKDRHKTTEAGSFAANAWGLHDMHGNVAEWCEDLYGKGYYKFSPLRDPQGPAFGEFHSVRGGSWNSAPAGCRSASRFNEKTDVRDETIGFRVVLRLPAVPQKS